jgi:hypothetical protein
MSSERNLWVHQMDRIDAFSRTENCKLKMMGKRQKEFDFNLALCAIKSSQLNI